MSAINSTSSSSNPPQEKPTTTNTVTTNTAIKIKCSNCGKEFAHRATLKRHHFYEHGKRGSTQKLKKKNKSQNVPNNNQDDLFKALNECAEGDEIKVLIDHIQPDSNLLTEIHHRIVEDLKIVFNRVLQRYSIHVFGSTITGLAMKDSDFDFFVHLPGNNIMDINEIKSLIRILRIECQKRTDLFSNSVPIYFAKVPLLKLTHAITGVQLDINFSNSFGIYNSNILTKLVKFDRRIYSLIMILKYWGKIYQITGSGKITNYSFSLMVIFLLQTLDEPIVPPIKLFQNNIPELMGNNCNFSFNDSITNTTKNQMNLFQLLKEFFIFYSNFNYLQDMICPYLGKIIKRSDYDSYFVTNDNNLFNMKTLICVQDPFEHDRNLISSCSKRNSELFMLMLKTTKSILLDENNNSLKSSEILIKMFSQPLQVINHVKNKSQTTRKIVDPNQLVCKLSVTKIDVDLLKNITPATEGPNKINLHRMWCTYNVDLLKPILENIYQMECKRLDSIDYINVVLESNKLTSATTPLDAKNILIYNIKTSCDLWTHLAKPIPYQTENYIDLEYNATKNILATANVQNSQNMLINCNVVLKLDSAYNFIEINFFSEIDDTNEHLKSFFKHFTNNIRNYVRGHLYDSININKYLATNAENVRR